MCQLILNEIDKHGQKKELSTVSLRLVIVLMHGIVGKIHSVVVCNVDTEV